MQPAHTLCQVTVQQQLSVFRSHRLQQNNQQRVGLIPQISQGGGGWGGEGLDSGQSASLVLENVASRKTSEGEAPSALGADAWGARLMSSSGTAGNASRNGGVASMLQLKATEHTATSANFSTSTAGGCGGCGEEDVGDKSAARNIQRVAAYGRGGTGRGGEGRKMLDIASDSELYPVLTGCVSCAPVPPPLHTWCVSSNNATAATSSAPAREEEQRAPKVLENLMNFAIRSPHSRHGRRIIPNIPSVPACFTDVAVTGTYVYIYIKDMYIFKYIHWLYIHIHAQIHSHTYTHTHQNPQAQTHIQTHRDTTTQPHTHIKSQTHIKSPACLPACTHIHTQKNIWFNLL